MCVCVCMHLKVCVGECHYKQLDVAGIPKGKARSDEAAQARKSHIMEGLKHSEAFSPDPRTIGSHWSSLSVLCLGPSENYFDGRWGTQEAIVTSW